MRSTIRSLDLLRDLLELGRGRMYAGAQDRSAERCAGASFACCVGGLSGSCRGSAVAWPGDRIAKISQDLERQVASLRADLAR